MKKLIILFSVLIGCLAMQGQIHTRIYTWYEWTGHHRWNSTLEYNGVIAPAQITANQNNYKPTGLSTANVLKISTDASRDITGLDSTNDGKFRLLFLVNIGAFDVVLKNQSGSSDAANRFAFAGDITVAGDQGIQLFYDSTARRWRSIGGAGSGGSGVNVYNSDGIVTGNRTLTGDNDTHFIALDSFNYFRYSRAGVTRIYGNNTTSSLYSPDGNTLINITNGLTQLSVSSASNYLWGRADSFLVHKRASYEGNIHSTFFPYSLVDKSYVDSVAGSGVSGIDDVLAVGQALTTTRTIDVGSSDLVISQSGEFTATFGSSGGGLLATSASNYGLYGISTEDVAGVAGENSSTVVGSIQAAKNISNTHLATPGIDLLRTTNGTALNGIGSKIRFITETSTGAEDTTNIIESFWSTVTHASRESQMNIHGVDNTSQEIFMNVQKDLVRINNNADTLATKAYARSVGGGGGISAADLPLRVTGSNVSADTSVAYSPSLTTNARTQKIIDSLSAAGWGANNIQYEPWYTHYLTTTGGNAQSEGFYGTYAGANASILNFGASAATVPGGWMYGQQMSTGTTAAGWCYHYGPGVPGGSYGQISINSSFRYNYGEKVRFEDLSDGTETYAYYCGFIDDVASFGAVVDGAGFRYAHTDSSGAWIMWTKSNSTLTEDATATTVAADTDYELEISIIGGTAYYYINKVLAGSISTNVPSGSTRNTTLGNSFEKSAGTTARSAYIEWMAYGKRRS